MKSEFFNKRPHNNRFCGHREKSSTQSIKWEQLVCSVLLISVLSSCDILSTNKVSTNVGVYMWSGTFQNTDNESLISVLEEKKVKSVLLSVGFQDPQIEKAEQFVQRANERKIEVNLLFGGNEIVRGIEDYQLSELNRLSEIAQYIGVENIHLNVEPHTFEDWDENRSLYEEGYLNMLNNAKNIFSEVSISLSVSIPHFYDSINPEIEKYVSEVVVMVYETTDTNIIKRRIEEESSVFKKKLSVSIRPGDYLNVEKMDKAIIEIMESQTVNRVYLHDAGAIINT